MKKNNEIDLYLVIIYLVHKKKFLLKVSSIFFIVGILFTFSMPVLYKSSSTFYPHYENNEIANSGNLRNLAGLAGINLQSTTSNNLPPNLYPNLLKSSSFKLNILDEVVEYNKREISFRNYLLLEQNKFSLSKLFNLPIIFFKSLFTHKSRIINEELNYISDEDYNLFKLLDEKITINVNEEDGLINLNVIDKSPEISALITKKSEILLQNNIINFKLKNVNDIYEFTLNQYELAKKKLYHIQDSLANFKDKNINIKSDLFLNQLNRLETEYNIQRNVYNELAITKEKTAIDVRKNTPIFTILNEVVVPNEKYSPNRLLIAFIFSIISLFVVSLRMTIKKFIF